MDKGLFITFEGGEGSGKTTQIKLLAKLLESWGKKVLLTKEPGGDESICKKIRTLLLDPEHKNMFDDRAELFLFLADRAQHIGKVIIPALNDNIIVLCDRFAGSTFAYQYYARQVADFSFIKNCNDFVSRNLIPDMTFFINVDPEIGMERKKNDTLTRIDQEDMIFHKRVQQGYQDFFKSASWECTEIDGALEIIDIQKIIREKMHELIK